MLATMYSTRFGEIEVAEDEIFHFPESLPGFENLKSFIIVRTNPEAVFCYLHSLDDLDICFIITDPFLFYPEYEFDLPDGAIEELKLSKPECAKIWSIISVPNGKGVEQATINLVAPIVVNTVSKQSKQVILQNTNYSIRQPLLRGDE